MYRFFSLCFFIIINYLSYGFYIHAQDTSNPDSEYLRIKKIALEGNMPEAEKQMAQLLTVFPEYGDGWVLLARIYGWQEKYEPATKILDSIIFSEPGNIDALEARLDLAIWKGENEVGIEIVDRILNTYPNIDEIIISSSGDTSLSEILEIRRENFSSVNDTIIPPTEEVINTDETGINDNNDELKNDNIQKSKTDLRAGYYFDTFSQPYSRFWQVFQLGTCHHLPFGKILPGINIGNLHADLDTAIHATELQFEIEAYPKITEKMYAWLNYAYSPGDYFPSHRFSVEVWHNLIQGWVASAGLNYFYFYRNLYIPNISLEKYYKTWWFSSKVYFYMKDEGTTTSLYLNARKYFNDTDFLQLTAGTGTAPDEPFEIQISLMRLNAHTLKITYFKAMNEIFSFRCGAGYSYEKYAESQFRNRFEGYLSLIYSLNKRK